MTALIVLLYAIGIILVLFEVIVPGGVLGVLGALCLMGGCGVAFYQFGLTGGLVGLFSALALLGLGLFIEFRLLPRTRLGRRMFLGAAVTGRSTQSPDDKNLVGRAGETVTALAPSGIVVIDGRKYEAFSQSGFVERGAHVVVRAYDNFRLIVEKT